jgi:hypothetical protein
MNNVQQSMIEQMNVITAANILHLEHGEVSDAWRQAAANVAADQHPRLLVKHVDDPDPVIRSVAITHAWTYLRNLETWLKFLHDPDKRVVEAMCTALKDDKNNHLFGDEFRVALMKELQTMETTSAGKWPVEVAIMTHLSEEGVEEFDLAKSEDPSVRAFAIRNGSRKYALQLVNDPEPENRIELIKKLYGDDLMNFIDDDDEWVREALIRRIASLIQETLRAWEYQALHSAESIQKEEPYALEQCQRYWKMLRRLLANKGLDASTRAWEKADIDHLRRWWNKKFDPDLV